MNDVISRSGQAVAPDRHIETADPTNIVIFGAAGDLTKRKLMPALVRMLDCGLVHPDSRIIGVVNNRTEEVWLNLIRDGLNKFSPQLAMDDARWAEFSSRLSMVPGDLASHETYGRLADALQTLDLETARALNRELQAVFYEKQIYRIDHYLGKESVQNLLVYRFANSIMEPLWNRNYIDHIQISVAETLGIEYRAKYYEHSGALRDMIQSHLMQVMTLVAMEPPVEFTADAVRDEKMKVLRAVRRFDPEQVRQQTAAAQYASGTVADEQVPAYVAEDNVSPDSATETFAAVRFYIDNWRWQGVPFILWTGKRLPKKASEVMIRFSKPPFNHFDSHASIPAPNALVFRLQPDGGVVLRLNAKKPGLTTDNEELVMRAPYADDASEVADAYEVLMHDVLTGDGTLFSRSDEVEESWDIVEPILNGWKDRVSIERYRAGTWDIPAMDELSSDCACGWHKPS